MVLWLDSLFAFWYQKSVTSQAGGGLFLLHLVLGFYYTFFCQLHFLIELLEITCEWQVTASCQSNTFPKHILRRPSIYIKRYKQLKKELWKTATLTSF